MAAGFVAGFARVSIGFLAAILGVVFGFWFYGIPAGWVHRYLHSVAVSNLIGFLLVFWAILAIGALLAKVSSKLFKWTGLSWLDRLLGGPSVLVRGALIAVVMIAVLLAFTPKPMPNWMVNSQCCLMRWRPRVPSLRWRRTPSRTPSAKACWSFAACGTSNWSRAANNSERCERGVAEPDPKEKKQK